MRSSSARCSSRVPLLLCAVLPLAVLGGGCVSLDTHRALEAERASQDDRIRTLDEEVAGLERSIVAQQNERARLLEEIEELRAERNALEADVAARDEKLVSLQGTYHELVADLEQQVTAGAIEIERLREGLQLNLSQEILFPIGSATLSPGGDEVLLTVAERVAALGYRVEVMGYTDDRPIQGSLAQRYPSNWELAGARAASVVRVLESGGVDPARLAAVSFGPNRPRASNETAEGRARNRRIEIRLLPEAGAATGTEEPDLEPAYEAEPAVAPSQGSEVAPPSDADPSLEPAPAPDGA